MLDNHLRHELIDLLCNHPPLTARDGRDVWLMNLPSRVRELIPHRHDRCKTDLAFIIDAFQSQQLADGRSPILVLIDALLPEMEDLMSGRKLKMLRQQIESSLVGTPILTQLENPFFHRTLIRDQRFFFGRTAETRKVLSLVTKEQPQPVSIVGPRRIGKSSFLFHLSDPQVTAMHGLGDNYVFVYIDCGALSGDKSNVYRALLQYMFDVIEETRSGNVSTQCEFQEPMTYLDFEKCLAKITAPHLQVVFLFDEFEKMVENSLLGQSFFNELRRLNQIGKVVYATASAKTLYELTSSNENVLGSPFFNSFYRVQLGLMKPHEARSLIDNLATMADFGGFDDNDYAFLQEIAGLHPFYLQIACYLLFEEKVERGDLAVQSYDRVRQQFDEEVAEHFRYTWERLSNAERKALRLIAEGCLDEVTVKDRKRLGQKCLVYQDIIFSSGFGEFVREQSQQVSQVCADSHQSLDFGHFWQGDRLT